MAGPPSAIAQLELIDQAKVAAGPVQSALDGPLEATLGGESVRSARWAKGGGNMTLPGELDDCKTRSPGGPNSARRTDRQTADGRGKLDLDGRPLNKVFISGIRRPARPVLLTFGVEGRQKAASRWVVLFARAARARGETQQYQ